MEPPILRLRLLDLSGKVLPNQDYQLVVSGRERFGATNGSGILEEPLEYGVHSAVLSRTVLLHSTSSNTTASSRSTS